MSSSDGKKRLVKSRSGLRVVYLDGKNCSPFELREPFWIPDEETPACMKCQAKFAFLTRRHHCRRCGNIYCSHCCEQKIPLPRMCFVDPVRICDGCSEVTKKENEFYDKHLKTLISGANFFLNESREVDSEISFLCCLATDHQSIVFDGGNVWQHVPVPLAQIVSLKVLGASGSPGSTQVIGANLKYLDSNKEQQELHLSVASVPNRKQSVAWITALQKGLKFITPAAESP